MELPIQKIKIKAFFRKCKDGNALLIGVVYDGSESFDIPQTDTVVIAGEMLITSGVKEARQDLSGVSNGALIQKL